MTARLAGRQVVFTHDRYRGRRLEALPDMVVCWASDAPIQALECPVYGTVTGGLKFVDRTHSMHTGEGLAVVCGPNIPQAEWPTARPLVDLTATLYRLMGEEVPPYVEGEPLELAAAD